MRNYFIKSKIAFQNLGIREKLLTAFIVLISIPIFIIAFGSYTISRNIMENKTYQYSHDILFQTSKTLEARLEKIEDISFNIVFNNEVQSMLLEASLGNMDIFENIQTRIQIENILAAHVLYHDEINAIYAISSGGYTYELNKTKQKYGFSEEHLLRMEEARGGPLWIGGLEDNRIAALMRQINSVRTQLPIGYMVIYVDEAYLFDLLKSTYSLGDGKIYIIDQDGIIISSAEKEQIGNTFPVERGTLHNDEYHFNTMVIDDISQYVAISEPMSNGWRICTSVPISIYLQEIRTLRNTILLSTIALLVFALFFAKILSTGISKPIRTLSSIMKKFGKGDFTLRCPEGAKDETGMLSETFNQMADNINELVEKVYEEQLMKRDAELKSLQMQINPHFLYNTLETINWMARTHGNQEIGIMAKSLGDLMRYTINSQDQVLLKEDINSLNHYLQIQKYRYGDKLDAEFMIEPATENLYIPKLLIQPLVENAIYHGIEPVFEKGLITINSRRVDDFLFLQIKDNGVGMTEEMIDQLLNGNTAKSKPTPYSIGLQNVTKRIKTIYGQEYGIHIQSELGEGTEITVKLPAVTLPSSSN